MSGKAASPPQPAWKLGVLVGGLLLLLVGLVLVYLGLKPLAPILELFGGGAPSDESMAFLDELDGHLAAAAWPVGGGTLALLAGFVLVKVGLSPPKPKSVEQLVQEEVERRVAQLGPAATMVPRAAPPASPPVPGPVSPAFPPNRVNVPVAQVPISAAPARRTHCTCGSVLVAGGRLCPNGHAQG